MSAPPEEPDIPVAHAGFWKRRVGDVVVAQFRQGITPEKIALTVALGGVLAVFPILGSTTLLCALVAFCLGLNQPIMQLVNYFCYPLQLALLLPFYRAGETLFRQPHVPIASIGALAERFWAGPWQFLIDYGMVALYGITVWALIAPVLFAAVYVLVRSPVQKISERVRTAAPSPT